MAKDARAATFPATTQALTPTFIRIMRILIPTPLHSLSGQITHHSSGPTNIMTSVSFFSITIASSDNEPVTNSGPKYEYHFPSATLDRTRADLPILFQIQIHYEPHYEPFPIMVRATLEISELLAMLESLLNTKRLFFFIFYDYRLCEHRQRLQDIRGLVPGSTLLLAYWEPAQAIHFHSLYNRLNHQDTAELYWNFQTLQFQRAHPYPSRQQQPSPHENPAIYRASPAMHCPHELGYCEPYYLPCEPCYYSSYTREPRHRLCEPRFICSSI